MILVTPERPAPWAASWSRSWSPPARRFECSRAIPRRRGSTPTSTSSKVISPNRKRCRAPSTAWSQLVFSLSMGPELGAHATNLALAARRAGTKHIVKLSVLGAGTNSGNAVVGWHDTAEKAIQDSGASWTFVRPGMFMSNALNWAPAIRSAGKVFLPYGEGKVVAIHPRDIASVAAKALTEPGHENKAYSLTGAQALGATEMMAILSEVVGKPIAYVPVSDEAAGEAMLKAGMPPILVEALMKLAGGIRRGEAGTPLPTLEQVLGRKALDMARPGPQRTPAAFR